MASKKPVVRCEVCGMKATQYVFNVLPICDNIVCAQAKLDEVNKAIEEASNEGVN